jgi:hypothetical protein
LRTCTHRNACERITHLGSDHPAPQQNRTTQRSCFGVPSADHRRLEPSWRGADCISEGRSIWMIHSELHSSPG